MTFNTKNINTGYPMTKAFFLLFKRELSTNLANILALILKILNKLKINYYSAN